MEPLAESKSWKMNRHNTLLSLICLFCFSVQYSNAQDIKLNEAVEVQDVVTRHIQSNKSNPSIEGWRIQILSSSDRNKVENVKSEFRSYFPGLWIDWKHIKPNYKLQAGAYKSYLECQSDLERIKKKYPGAYATKVKDMNPKEIIGW